MIDYDALRVEVLRIHLRYSIEVIEGFDFCPWAKAARCSGRVRTQVLFGAEPALDTTLQALEDAERDDGPDIALLVFPELTLSRVAFQHFAAKLRERTTLSARGRRDVFAIADFHPDVEPDLHSPERLVAYIRKAPDPTLQLVRHSALQAVRLGEGQGTRYLDASELASLETTDSARPDPLHTRIARANFNHVASQGVAKVAAALADIEDDRDHSYLRHGLLPPPWSRKKAP